MMQLKCENLKVVFSEAEENFKVDWKKLQQTYESEANIPWGKIHHTWLFTVDG